MNKTHLKSAVLIFSLIALGAGCGENGEGRVTQLPTPEPVPTATTTVTAPTTAAPTPKPTTLPTAPQAVKEFTVTAKNWEWNPKTITVKKGDKVVLHVSSADDDHGFGIREYNINVAFDGGETKTIEFTADKAGSFTFYCSVPCGEGHREMKGTLVVQE